MRYGSGVDKAMKMNEQRLLRLMQDDEGERLEFKSGMIKRSEITDYAVGIGNEGGGWLILGVTDRKPRRIASIPDPGVDELQKISDAVLDGAGIRVILEPVVTADGYVLAIRIPTRPHGQIFSTKTGKYLMRGREGLRGMPLAEIERIRHEELRRRDWLSDSIREKWQEVLDPLEFDRLRTVLKENQREELARLADADLLISLELLRGGKRKTLTRAAVALLGRGSAIREHIPTHEVKFQRFDKDELTPVLNQDTRAPLLAVVQRAAEIIEVANEVYSFQQGLFRVDIPKFPEPAYREAVANALIHRDYEQPGNVAIRVYRNRLEIGGPGGWFGGVNEHNILVTESRRRNELLAEVFQKIGLAERSAIGVKRMFRAMLESGKEPPQYRATTSSVTVTLFDDSFDQEFVQFAARCRKEGVELALQDLLILAFLRRHREISLKEAASQIQQSPDVSRRFVDDLRNKGLIDRRGDGRPRKYLFSARSYEWLALKEDRPKDIGMSEKMAVGLLLEELGRRKSEGITNREVRSWTGFTSTKVKRVLAPLIGSGQVRSSGKRGMGGRYWLTTYAPSGDRDGNNSP